VHVCSVCKREGGEIEGLVTIILWARPVRLVSLRRCTAYSAGACLLSQRWLTLEVQAPLNPVLVACHRFNLPARDINLWICVTCCACLPSLVNKHQCCCELSCGQAHTQTHTGDHNTCSASIQRCTDNKCHCCQSSNSLISYEGMLMGCWCRQMQWL